MSINSAGDIDQIISLLKEGKVDDVGRLLEQEFKDQKTKDGGVDVGDGWFEMPASIAMSPQILANLPGEVHVYQKCLLPKEPRVLVVITEAIDNIWHMSISCTSMLIGVIPNRLPSWEDTKSARYKFLPGDINMAQMLPPKEFYVDVHPTCMHWHQIPVGYCEDHRAYMKKDNGDFVFLHNEDMSFIRTLVPDLDEKLRAYRQAGMDKKNQDARALAAKVIKEKEDK